MTSSQKSEEKRKKEVVTQLLKSLQRKEVTACFFYVMITVLYLNVLSIFSFK